MAQTPKSRPAASERLCNLMSLAAYQIENNCHAELKEKLETELGAIRDRLVGMGARLMVEKLERIDRRAEEVLQERDYPLGLAGKLDIAFANLMDNLKVLGGAARLGDKVPELVAKTESDIGSLAEIEKNLGVLKEVRTARHKPAPATEGETA